MDVVRLFSRRVWERAHWRTAHGLLYSKSLLKFFPKIPQRNKTEGGKRKKKFRL